MGWLAELLLESPIPPSVWMPNDHERRARGKLVVDAILRGRPRHRGWHPGHRLHDLGGVYGNVGRSRYVSGDEIEDAIASSLTHLNPPSLQGWTYVLWVLVGWMGLLVLRAAAAPEIRGLTNAVQDLIVVAVGVGAIVAWFGWLQREIEVCEHGIVVRRWTDVWGRREGFVVGMPETIRARVHREYVELDGPAAADVRVPLTFWPPSSRRAIGEDLRSLGLRVDHGEAPILPDPDGPISEPSRHHRKHH